MNVKKRIALNNGVQQNRNETSQKHQAQGKNALQRIRQSSDSPKMNERTVELPQNYMISRQQLVENSHPIERESSSNIQGPSNNQVSTSIVVGETNQNNVQRRQRGLSERQDASTSRGRLNQEQAQKTAHQQQMIIQDQEEDECDSDEFDEGFKPKNGQKLSMYENISMSQEENLAESFLNAKLALQVSPKQPNSLYFNSKNQSGNKSASKKLNSNASNLQIHISNGGGGGNLGVYLSPTKQSITPTAQDRNNTVQTLLMPINNIKSNHHNIFLSPTQLNNNDTELRQQQSIYDLSNPQFISPTIGTLDDAATLTMARGSPQHQTRSQITQHKRNHTQITGEKNHQQQMGQIGNSVSMGSLSFGQEYVPKQLDNQRSNDNMSYKYKMQKQISQKNGVSNKKALATSTNNKFGLSTMTNFNDRNEGQHLSQIGRQGEGQMYSQIHYNGGNSNTSLNHTQKHSDFQHPQLSLNQLGVGGGLSNQDLTWASNILQDSQIQHQSYTQIPSRAGNSMMNSRIQSRGNPISPRYDQLRNQKHSIQENAQRQGGYGGGGGYLSLHKNSTATAQRAIASARGNLPSTGLTSTKNANRVKIERSQSQKRYGATIITSTSNNFVSSKPIFSKTMNNRSKYYNQGSNQQIMQQSLSRSRDRQSQPIIQTQGLYQTTQIESRNIDSIYNQNRQKNGRQNNNNIYTLPEENSRLYTQIYQSDDKLSQEQHIYPQNHLRLKDKKGNSNDDEELSRQQQQMMNKFELFQQNRERDPSVQFDVSQSRPQPGSASFSQPGLISGMLKNKGDKDDYLKGFDDAFQEVSEDGESMSKQQPRSQSQNRRNNSSQDRTKEEKGSIDQDKQKQQAIIIQKYLRGEISKDKVSILQNKVSNNHNNNYENRALINSKSAKNINSRRSGLQSARNKDTIIVNNFTKRMTEQYNEKIYKQQELEMMAKRQQEIDIIKSCTFKPDTSLTRNTNEQVSAKILSGQGNMSGDQIAALQGELSQSIYREKSPLKDFNSFYQRQQIYSKRYQDNMQKRLIEENERLYQSTSQERVRDPPLNQGNQRNRSTSVISKSRSREKSVLPYDRNASDQALNKSSQKGGVSLFKQNKSMISIERSSLHQQQSGPPPASTSSVIVTNLRQISESQQVRNKSRQSQKARDLSEPKTTTYLERFKEQLRLEEEQKQQQQSNTSRVIKDPNEFFKRLSSPIVKTYRGSQSPVFQEHHNASKQTASQGFSSLVRKHRNNSKDRQPTASAEHLSESQRGQEYLSLSSLGKKQKQELKEIGMLDELKQELMDHVRILEHLEDDGSLNDVKLDARQIEGILIQMNMLSLKDKTNKIKVQRILKDLIEPVTVFSLTQFFTLLLKPPVKIRDQESEDYYNSFRTRNYYLIQNREDIRRSRQDRSFDGRSVRSNSQNSHNHSFSPNINSHKTAELSSKSKQRVLKDALYQSAATNQEIASQDILKLPLYKQQEILEQARLQKLEQQRQQKEEQAIKACTFRPQISRLKGGRQVGGGLADYLPQSTKNQVKPSSGGLSTYSYNPSLLGQSNVFEKLTLIAKEKRQKAKIEIKQRKIEQEREEQNSQAAKLRRAYERQLEKRREVTGIKVNGSSQSPSPEKKNKTIFKVIGHDGSSCNMYAAGSPEIGTEKVGQKTVLTIKQEFVANLTGIKEQNESISEAGFEHEHSPQIPTQSPLSEQQEESSKWGESARESGGTATANKSINQSRVNKSQIEMPLLHVDVKHNNGSITRLSIYEGDDVEVIAENFSKQYEISDEVKQKLVEYVYSQLERLKTVASPK